MKRGAGPVDTVALVRAVPLEYRPEARRLMSGHGV